ncbi:MAG TPA: hypothetical protein VIL35_07305 [Vicinamibacterales bacterium]
MVVDIVLKSSVVLLAAAAFHALSRDRVSAAVRHAVWLGALVSVLCVPVLGALLPRWEVPLLPSPARTGISATPYGAVTTQDWYVHLAEPDAAGAPAGSLEAAATRGPSPTQAPRGPATVTTEASAEGLAYRAETAWFAGRRDRASSLRTSTLLAAIWTAGTLLLLVRLTVSWILASRLVRHRPSRRAPWRPMARRLARFMGAPRRTRFVRSDAVRTPMACGLVRPAVLLPTAGPNRGSAPCSCTSSHTCAGATA